MSDEPVEKAVHDVLRCAQASCGRLAQNEAAIRFLRAAPANEAGAAVHHDSARYKDTASSIDACIGRSVVGAKSATLGSPSSQIVQHTGQTRANNASDTGLWQSAPKSTAN